MDSDQEGSLLKLLACLKFDYLRLNNLELRSKKNQIQDLMLVHFPCSMLGREGSV